MVIQENEISGKLVRAYGNSGKWAFGQWGIRANEFGKVGIDQVGSGEWEIRQVGVGQMELGQLVMAAPSV